MLNYVKFIKSTVRVAVLFLATLFFSFGTQMPVVGQSFVDPSASEPQVSALQVPSGMVLIEDLGPVGIGRDNSNLILETIESFYMDIHEVTKGLWDEVRA